MIINISRALRGKKSLTNNVSLRIKSECYEIDVSKMIHFQKEKLIRKKLRQIENVQFS